MCTREYLDAARAALREGDMILVSGSGEFYPVKFKGRSFECRGKLAETVSCRRYSSELGGHVFNTAYEAARFAGSRKATAAAGKKKTFKYGDIIVIADEKDEGMRKVNRVFALRDFCLSIPEGISSGISGVSLEAGEPEMDAQYTDEPSVSVCVSVKDGDGDELGTFCVKASDRLNEDKADYEVTFSVEGSEADREYLYDWISELKG